MYMQGIYIIKNKLDNKVYIGSAVDITRRWYKHKTELTRNVHPNQKLQRAWSKHGSENFSFEVIETVEYKSNLIEREQYYMDSSENELYNLCPVAYSVLGRAHSDETKKKIGDAHRGKIVSNEARENLRIAHLGQIAWNAGITLSDEQKKNFSQAQKNRFKTQNHPNQKTVIQLTMTGEYIKEWKSVAEASRELGIIKSSICSVCNGTNRMKSTGGYKWKYKE